MNPNWQFNLHPFLNHHTLNLFSPIPCVVLLQWNKLPPLLPPLAPHQNPRGPLLRSQWQAVWLNGAFRVQWNGVFGLNNGEQTQQRTYDPNGKLMSRLFRVYS